jgi:hypothetical protein
MTEPYIPLDEKLADLIMSAHHKAGILVGLMEGPKNNHLKTAIVRGLIRALQDDTETLACEVLEAYSKARNAI